MTCCYESKINDSDKKVILVCDDSKLQLKSMQRALSKHYHVITASSGYEAVAFASLYAPDLVILDITMYGMSGYEAAIKIKHNTLTKDIPIIFVTAHSSEQYRKRGIEVGASAFVEKPFDISNLVGIIDNLTVEKEYVIS